MVAEGRASGIIADDDMASDNLRCFPASPKPRGMNFELANKHMHPAKSNGGRATMSSTGAVGGAAAGDKYRSMRPFYSPARVSRLAGVRQRRDRDRAIPFGTRRSSTQLFKAGRRYLINKQGKKV